MTTTHNAKVVSKIKSSNYNATYARSKKMENCITKATAFNANLSSWILATSNIN